MGKFFCITCRAVFMSLDALIEHTDEHMKRGEGADIKEGVALLKQVVKKEAPISFN